MLILASDVHRGHNTLELSRRGLIDSTEAPVRAERILEAVTEAGHHIEAPGAIDLDALAHIHTREYLDFLATAWPRWVDRFGDEAPAMTFCWPAQRHENGPRPRPDDLVGQLGYHSFAADCSIGPGTWAAATEAAAIAQTSVDRCAGSAAVYGLCRPPGHHATADQFGGYCFVNNSAAAAQRFVDRGAATVAILDIDYHHGNGTQSIFYRRSDVLTVSLHADPSFEFPWFSGHADERGVGPGEGHNLNLPLPAKTDVARWDQALAVALDRIADSGAEALVVAFGVDTFVDDPLGSFTLATTDYPGIGNRLRDLDLPTVILQEGGYATSDIGTNVAAFLSGFE